MPLRFSIPDRIKTGGKGRRDDAFEDFSSPVTARNGSDMEDNYEIYTIALGTVSAEKERYQK